MDEEQRNGEEKKRHTIQLPKYKHWHCSAHTSLCEIVVLQSYVDIREEISTHCPSWSNFGVLVSNLLCERNFKIAETIFYSLLLQTNNNKRTYRPGESFLGISEWIESMEKLDGIKTFSL